MDHRNVTEVHQIYDIDLVFANAAARVAYVAGSDEVGRVGWQTDDDTVWFLADHSPMTWVDISVQSGSGDTGVTGDQGDTGIQGDTGTTGDQGDTGIQGDTGDQGDTGVLGGTGVTGDTGIGNTSGSVNVPTHTDTNWYTVLTIATSSDTALALDVLVSGHSDDAAIAVWAYHMLAYTENDGGSLSVGNNTPTVITEYDGAYDVQIAVSGTNALVQVRRNGGSDYDIDWAVMAQVASF